MSSFMSDKISQKDLSVTLDALLEDDLSSDEFALRVFNLQYEKIKSTNPELAEIMRICAIPSRFDAQIIGILRDKPGDHKNNEHLLEQLKSFQFVQTRKDGLYVYHDNTRDALLREWKNRRNKKQYKELIGKLVVFYTTQGYIDIQKGKYKEAMAEFYRALKLERKNSELYFWLGFIQYYFFEDFKTALLNFNRAINLDPHKAQFYQGRGRAYIGMKKFKAALSNLNKAIELDPNEASNYFWRGNVNLSTKDLNAALMDFNKAIHINPKVVELYLNRGQVQILLQQYKAAKSDFTKCIVLEPKNDDAYFFRGITQYNLNKYQDAAQDFTTAIHFRGKFSPYYHWRGTTYYQLKNYRAALSDLNKTIQLDPKIDVPYYWRGLTHHKLKKYTESLSDFNKGLKLSPKNNVIYQARGEVYLELGNFKAALADFNRVIKSNPDNGPCYQSRGIAHLLSKNYKKALPDFDTVISLGFSKENSYYWRGLCLLSCKKYPDALQDLEAAVKLDKKRQSHSMFWRGVAHQFNNSFQQAKKDLNQAHIAAEKESDIYLKQRILAKVALLMGHKNEAQKLYDKTFSGSRNFLLYVESDYLDRLAKLFRSRNDIQEIKEWFNSKLKRVYS
jgi:tetratricopeptide (TPR) repeat protein